MTVPGTGTPPPPRKPAKPTHRYHVGGGGCFGLVLLVVFGFIAAGAITSAKDDPPATVTVTSTLPDPRVPKLQRSNRRWHKYGRKLERINGAQRRMLLASPTVFEAIELAAATYGNAATLWRKARCESGLRFWVRHSSAADSPTGLFQFKPSTFASTPYRGFSIVSPYANALAAGWMHTHDRGGEWDCR